jgi:hypothetical protein
LGHGREREEARKIFDGYVEVGAISSLQEAPIISAKPKKGLSDSSIEHQLTAAVVAADQQGHA